MKAEKSPWYVYMVCCADNSLYTGITTDLERRVKQHNGSKAGAKYTRSRQPVSLVYFEEWATRSQAGKREYYLKRLSPSQKRALLLTKLPKQADNITRK